MEQLELNEKSLIFHLRQYREKRRLTFSAETGSTNDDAKKLCREGRGARAWVVAAGQTQGRGRSGRSFYSPKGAGIYMSAVYELTGSEKNLGLLPSLAGLAVRNSLYNLFGLDCRIRWPNDILLDGKKLCGILCELVSAGNRPKYAVAGIGLNVGPCAFPDELSYAAGCVADSYSGEIDRNELAVDILNDLDRCILRNNALNADDTREFINRLKRYSATVGENVRVVTPDGSFDGRALDIDEKGALVLKTALETRTFTAGEVVYLC